MTHDICIIGHITEDRVEIAGQAPRVQPGGTAYYAGIAAQRLGLATAVVTRLRMVDRGALLADLVALGVAVRALPSVLTTRFVNIYPASDPDARRQRVDAVADPFHPDELAVDARLYLLGPLTRHELSPACAAVLGRRGGRVALDLQGLLRSVADGQVVLSSPDRLPAYLEHVDVLKASSEEAMFVTGASTAEGAARALAAMGPPEVIVTSGSQGSLLLVDGEPYTIPAYPPPAVVDATGCGDTYFSAYLARRLAGDTAEEAGHFAATVAAAKIAHHGAFRGVRPLERLHSRRSTGHAGG